jgi:hypothetical protein
MGLPSRLEAGDRLQRAEEFAPSAALLGEDLAAFGRKPVVPPSALTRFLDPFPFDPPTSFHPVQHGVEGGDVKPEHSARPVVNQLCDFVAVAGSLLNGSEDHEFRASALDVCMRRHMLWGNIYLGLEVFNLAWRRPERTVSTQDPLRGVDGSWRSRCSTESRKCRSGWARVRAVPVPFGADPTFGDRS